MATGSPGTANGFVKERMLRSRRFIPVLTVGAEAADVISVSIQLQTDSTLDAAEAASTAITLECVLVDDTGIDSLAAAFTLAATTGTEVTTTAQGRLIVTTTAAGLAVLDVTDIVTASGATVHLLVRPLNQPGFTGYTALTFD